MINTYDIYLISDSTGETLERIFLAIKAQFKNFKYKTMKNIAHKNENDTSAWIPNNVSMLSLMCNLCCAIFGVQS